MDSLFIDILRHFMKQCSLDKRAFQIRFTFQRPFYLLLSILRHRKVSLNVRKYSVVMFVV